MSDKLYLVTTSIEIDMLVVAGDPDAAERVAAENFDTEVGEVSIRPRTGSPAEITSREAIPKDWLGCLPYDWDTVAEEFFGDDTPAGDRTQD